MRVLSEGVPMTCGEVYALVRRRRDERTAMTAPSFGLQRHLCESTNSVSVGNTDHGIPSHTATSAAMSQTGMLAGNAARSALTSSSVAVNRASAVAYHMTEHALILLSEVKLLNYLCNHAHMTTAEDGSVSHIYGPSSVLPEIDTQGDDCHSESNQDHTSNDVNGPDKDTNESVERGGSTLTISHPGMRAYVRTVRAVLSEKERTGNMREARYAAGVRAVMQSLYRRKMRKSSTPTAASVKQERSSRSPEQTLNANNGTSYSYKHSSNNHGNNVSFSEDVVATTACKRRPAVKPLLSKPSNLLPSSPSLHGEQVGVNGSGTCQAPCLLTSMELMRLVQARPRCGVEVHRLIDSLDERLCGDEEAMEIFAQGVVDVFTQG